MKNYYTYMVTNKSNRVLHTGVTSDIERRMEQHRQKTIPGFTSRYRTTKLVYYEHYENVKEAIMREKQIKGWLRNKKNDLIETVNPNWEDLSREWSICHPERSEECKT